MSAVAYATSGSDNQPSGPRSSDKLLQYPRIHSYASAKDAVEKVLVMNMTGPGTLSAAIRREEDTIIGNIKDCDGKLYMNHSDVDVTLEPITSVSDLHRLGADSSARTDIVYTKLKSVAQEIDRIAGEVISTCTAAVEPGGTSVVHRPAGIGSGTEGPMPEQVRLTGFLRQLLGELSWEADDMAENFRTAVEVMNDADFVWPHENKIRLPEPAVSATTCEDALSDVGSCLIIAIAQQRLQAIVNEIEGGYPDHIDYSVVPHESDPRLRRHHRG